MRGILGLVAALLAGSAAFAAPSGITAAKPWMRYLLPGIPAAGYLLLQNNSDTPAILTSAASPACGMLMLHESEDNSGMAMMMDVPSVVVPAHGSVSFAPGGYHLMCMQPKMKVGSAVRVTLTFQGGSTLALSMPVFGAAGGP